MIYLIDEKKERQVKYGWSLDRFLKYKDIFTIVSDYEQLKNISSTTILDSPNNIIMLHDSFFKNLDIDEKVVYEFKNRIRSNDLYFVTFGGSFDSTFYDNKTLQLRVHQFYRNLQNFLENSYIDLRILAYGNNFKNEEFLTIKNMVWNFLFRYNDLDKLTDQDKYNLLTSVKFNELITNVLEECNSVAEIKTILNKWKI
jgi:hypothetical protein